MNLKKLFFASALLFAACGTIQAQEVIAHRGFWTTDGSAQNSLAALVKADSIHCYGSEFDVWLTTDNQLVVNHDATFKGVTMQDATARYAPPYNWTTVNNSLPCNSIWTRQKA